MTKLGVEAAEEGEDQLSIADRIAKLGEGGGHRLKAAAVVRDGQGALLEGCGTLPLAVGRETRAA